MEADSQVFAACVGALGLFGNSLLQLCAIWLLAKRSGLELVLPQTWARKYRHYFPRLDFFEKSDQECYSRPLVADRVVLSHPGWRAWALRHPTGMQLAAALQRNRGAHIQAPRTSAGQQERARQQEQQRPSATSGEQGKLGFHPGHTPHDSDVTATITREPGQASETTHSKQPPGAATTTAYQADTTSCGSVQVVGAGELGALRSPRPQLHVELSQKLDLGWAPPSAISGRQLRAHFPQVCGADLHADPEQLRARLRGRGLWGWFQFETSALRPHRDELTGLLALDEALGEALGEALDEALDYVMGADATLGGGGGCLRHEDSSCDSGRRGASSTATGDAASGVSTATEGADHDSGEALSSSNDHARDTKPQTAPRTTSATVPRPRLVVVHIRRGDFRELLQPPAAASAVSTLAAAPPSALAAADSPGAAATSRPLRDSPPFEIDGQQGGAWTDKSGVDFRVPLDWYGDALRALPLDSGRDVLWVCSDDRELALSGQVCGFRATSWPAAAAAAMEAAAAAAAGATVTKPGEAAVGEAPRQAPPGRATMRAAPWIQLVREHAVIADWFVMQRADVLLISNSTFSFTAAMLSQPRGSSHGPCAAGATATTSSGHSQALLRPDPTLAAFRPFDPWGELPLLPSAPVSSNHSVRQQHQKRQQQQKL